jgi:Cu+-exporting ATPase
MITGEPCRSRRPPETVAPAARSTGRGASSCARTHVGRDAPRPDRRWWRRAAQSAPIQKLADKVAAYFVPGRPARSVVTFAVWALVGPEPRLAHALVNAVAVLIIACPCALGLATPMSIMVGTGPGRDDGRAHQERRARSRRWRRSTRSCSTRRAPSPRAKPRSWPSSPLRAARRRAPLLAAASLERRASILSPLPSSRRRQGERADARRRRVGLSRPSAGRASSGRWTARQTSRSAIASPHGARARSPWRRRGRPLRSEGQTVVFVVVDGQLAACSASPTP